MHVEVNGAVSGIAVLWGRTPSAWTVDRWGGSRTGGHAQSPVGSGAVAAAQRRPPPITWSRSTCAEGVRTWNVELSVGCRVVQQQFPRLRGCARRRVGRCWTGRRSRWWCSRPCCACGATRSAAWSKRRSPSLTTSRNPLPLGGEVLLGGRATASSGSGGHRSAVTDSRSSLRILSDREGRGFTISEGISRRTRGWSGG